MDEIRKKITRAKRIIFKFGTSILTRGDGRIALSRIYSFVESLADLKKQGKEILIVTSGSVGLGAKKLNLEKRPDTIIMKKACAAIGMGQLISIYENGFATFSINTAQVLLTVDDFSNRKRYLNLKNTLNKLLELGIIPIINENDTVSNSEEIDNDTKKLSFNDNDKLSALIMSKLKSDLLIILSDIDGLYDDDPRKNKDAKIISIVDEIDENIEKLGFDASNNGTGGMKTKLEAAKIVMNSNGMALIVNGKIPQLISRIFNGEEIGTVFIPIKNLSSKKRWIAYATNITGKIKVNDGAKRALIENCASLLPSGIIEVKYEFNKGETVSIIDSEENEFAKGIVNYSSEYCKKIIGKKLNEIANEIEGTYSYPKEVITRDNIVIL